LDARTATGHRLSVVIREAQNLGDSGEYLTLRQWYEVQMSEEDLELLIAMDDPGEDTLEEDTFHLQADNTTARRSGQPQQGGDPTSKQK
jgi:hypothetical protein